MGPFQDDQIMDYTRQMLRALTYLEEKLIIHRDLKGTILTSLLSPQMQSCWPYRHAAFCYLQVQMCFSANLANQLKLSILARPFKYSPPKQWYKALRGPFLLRRQRLVFFNQQSTRHSIQSCKILLNLGRFLSKNSTLSTWTSGRWDVR